MIIQGIAHWAKIVGDPQPGYDKSKLEWSLDLEIDADTKKKLTKEGLGPKIKTSKDGEYDFLAFKRPAVRSDGTPSKPIKVVGPDGKTPFTQKIGNGSVLNVSFLINETKYQGKTHLKPGILAVQVAKHVAYEGRGDDFEAIPVDSDGNEDWSGED